MTGDIIETTFDANRAGSYGGAVVIGTNTLTRHLIKNSIGELYLYNQARVRGVPSVNNGSLSLHLGDGTPALVVDGTARFSEASTLDITGKFGSRFSSHAGYLRVGCTF